MGKTNRHTRRQEKATGRPSGLTAENHGKIVEAVRKGLPITYAGPLVGMDPSTVKRWLARGKREPDGVYRDFFAAIKTAQSEFVQSRMGRISQAADDGTWTAAAWLLERLYAEEFAADRTEMVALRREIRELRAILEKKRGESGDGGPTADKAADRGSDGPAGQPPAPAA